MAIVLQTSAGLRFFGDDLDPDEITTLLKGNPTHSARKGMPKAYPVRVNPLIARTGSWLICSDQEKGDRLSEQIAAILTSLNDDIGIWRMLTTRFRADMYCGIWMDESNQGLAVDPLTLTLLGERSLTLELDIYCNETAEI